MNVLRTMLYSKIHRATVTQADIHYVGSVTLDADLMAAADIVEGQQVDVVDITNGARLTTYAITGDAGSGIVGINGAAARLIAPGDLVIIICYAQLDKSEVAVHSPRVVHVNGQNCIVEIGADPSQPVPGASDQIRGDKQAGDIQAGANIPGRVDLSVSQEELI